MARFQAPYYPVIYVRGYAMTQGEIDETTADPFCGFNIGSTVLRATADKKLPPRKYVFESPVVRLMSDYGYTEAYEDGHDILDPEWERDASGRKTDNRLDARCILIHRYYDEASLLLGSGAQPDIRQFARDLSTLVDRVRELVCANPANGVQREDFKCYLVAHSMGGLVCRAMLQNPALDPHGATACVDKFFTYATPHNGIDVAGINVPRWLSLFAMNTFNRGAGMAGYLGLDAAYAKHDRVDLMPADRMSPRRIFTMVGTNRMDYEVAAGLSRTFVGHGSDGLVRIENATLNALNADGSVGEQCGKAFAFRSHSGYFGIVNSEEAFQNLTRFLFGDVRVDIWLDIDAVRLPPAVVKAAKGRPVAALYQVELQASARGKLWQLTRRRSEEDSPACVTQAQLETPQSLYLSTVFLANRARVNPNKPGLSHSLELGVRTPDYEIDRRLWLNEHYEGNYLFRDVAVLELFPPASPDANWKVTYSWQGNGVSAPKATIDVTPIDKGSVQLSLPIESLAPDGKGNLVPASAGLKGSVRLVVSSWNDGAVLER
jgi:hypothetical protein